MSPLTQNLPDFGIGKVLIKYFYKLKVQKWKYGFDFPKEEWLTLFKAWEKR